MLWLERHATCVNSYHHPDLSASWGCDRQSITGPAPPQYCFTKGSAKMQRHTSKHTLWRLTGYRWAYCKLHISCKRKAVTTVSGLALKRTTKYSEVGTTRWNKRKQQRAIENRRQLLSISKKQGKKYMSQPTTVTGVAQPLVFMPCLATTTQELTMLSKLSTHITSSTSWC